MMNSRILLALSAMLSPVLQRPVVVDNTPRLHVDNKWKGRNGSDANHKYFHAPHDKVTVTRPKTKYMERYEVTFSADGLPKKRGYRKGVNTVPRAPVNSLHAISFSR